MSDVFPQRARRLQADGDRVIMKRRHQDIGARRLRNKRQLQGSGEPHAGPRIRLMAERV